MNKQVQNLVKTIIVILTVSFSFGISAKEPQIISIQTGTVTMSQTGIRTQEVQSSSAFSLSTLQPTNSQTFRKIAVVFAVDERKDRLLSQYIELGSQIYPFSSAFKISQEMSGKRFTLDYRYKIGFEYSISFGKTLIDTIFQDTAEISAGTLGFGGGVIQLYRIFSDVYLQLLIKQEYAIGFLSPVEYSSMNTMIFAGLRVSL